MALERRFWYQRQRSRAELNGNSIYRRLLNVRRRVDIGLGQALGRIDMRRHHRRSFWSMSSNGSCAIFPG